MQYAPTAQRHIISFLGCGPAELGAEHPFREFANPEYLAGLLEAKREIREGKGIPAEEVFRQAGF